VGRNLDKLEDFKNSWDYNLLKSRICVHSWDNLSDLLPQSDLIVNTTPVGMSPNINKSPLTMAEVSLLNSGAIVYDLIYTPRPTLLLQQAQKRGLIIIDGAQMLVQQGAVGFTLWTGKQAPVDEMTEALLEALKKA